MGGAIHSALVPVDHLIRHAIQSRAQCSDEVAEYYAERIKAGDEFPRPACVKVGPIYHLWDGLHRAKAYAILGKKEIKVDYRSGTKAWAEWLSSGANLKHGLRRTPEDKRKAVVLALQAKPEESDRTIADHTATSHTFVAQVRKEKGAHQKKIENKAKGPKDATLDSVNQNVPEHLGVAWGHRLLLNRAIERVSDAMVVIEEARNNDYPVFRQPGVVTALSQLAVATSALKDAMPYAVCPDCHGETLESCGSCGGIGFVNKLAWNKKRI